MRIITRKEEIVLRARLDLLLTFFGHQKVAQTMHEM